MEVDSRKKKQKFSKNKKKSWRKHADVADIEDYFEDQRRDERTGGKTDTRSSGSLFFIDKDAKKSNAQNKNKKQKSDDEDEEEEYIPGKMQKLRSLEKEHQEELKKSNEEKNRKIVNIWGQEVISIARDNDFLEPVAKKAKVKPKTVGTGKLKIEAVTKPDPGASYNPDFESHQKLLAMAHNAEVTKLKQIQKVNSKVKMVSVAELKKQSQVWMKEMSQGLPGCEEEDDEDIEEDNGEEEQEEISKSSSKPKTSQQKRKAKLLKLLESEKYNTKLTKQRLNDIYRLKSIKKEIKQAEQEHEARIKARKARLKIKEETEVKRFSKYKYQEGEIDVQLSEDLSGSLRGLKPEGNLLKERFKSFQRRNMIEIRRPVVPHRKYKRKVFTKRSYNVPTIKEFEPVHKKKK